MPASAGPGGVVGSGFDATSGSEVNISGGEVFGQFFAFNSVVNISGGTVGDDFQAAADSQINITGGTVGDGLGVFGGEINLSGGTVGNDFDVNFGSVVNISGSEFFIDGVELDTLLPGEAFTITGRDMTLSGLLADVNRSALNLTQLIR